MGMRKAARSLTLHIDDRMKIADLRYQLAKKENVRRLARTRAQSCKGSSTLRHMRAWLRWMRSASDYQSSDRRTYRWKANDCED